VSASEPIPPPQGDEQLGRLVRRGLSWSLIGVMVGKLTTLVTGIILARLLAPKDFGVFAVALVALVIIVNLNDLGLEQCLVRWPGSIAEVAPTAKTIILASSVVQFAVLYAVAPYFTQAMHAPEATGIVRLLSFGVVINGAFAVPSAVLSRTFRQDLRTAADFTGFIVGLGITVTLAVLGWGAWSLAWGRLIGNALNGVLHAVFARERYHYGLRRDVVRPLVGQGLPLAGLSVIAVAVLNVDNLVVGRVLGPIELGFYTLAFNLSSWPVSVFAVAVWRVSVPGFARLQTDPERLRSAFTRSFGLLMAATLPVCLVLSALAHPLVRFVYGEKWVPAATALSVLAALGALRIGLQLMTDVLVAVGRGRRAFLLQVVWLAALVPSLTVGARLDGLRGVAIGHVVVAAGLMLPLHLSALHPLGISGSALARAAARPLISTAVAGAVAFALATLGYRSDFMQLLIVGLATMLVFLIGVAPMRHGLRALARD
jgi:Membrane protein involved in the export of O-antigen and teichoic acid